MDIHMLTKFFMWCTIINGGLFVYGAAMCMLAPNWVYRMKSKFFPMPRETFNAIIYSFLGLLKIIVIFFNLVPYLALLIIK